MFDRAEYGHMPDGVWAVQIASVKGVLNLQGEDILIHPHGFLLYHPPGPGFEERWSFCPTHRVERMWQVSVAIREGERSAEG